MDSGQDTDRRRKYAALLATVLFHALVAVLLLTIYLHAVPVEQRQWPPEDTSELLLDGEYVKIGDVASASNTRHKSSEKVSQPESTDPVDAGLPAPTPPSPVTSTQESPMKIPDKPTQEETGPTKAEREAADRARKEEEAKRRINNRMQFGSGNSSSTNSGSNTAGSPNGNSNIGRQSGAPGHSLKGRTLASWSKPRGKATGTITVSVRVNRKGNVIEASYSGGTGDIAGDAGARNSCVSAALGSRFSVNEDAPPEQTGTITYRFE